MKRLTKGFTLIELMIVVSIVGILAAIAIPSFAKYQLRSKFSEAASNNEGLRKAEEALRHGERGIVVAGTLDTSYSPGTYWNLGGGVLPSSTVGSAKLSWSAAQLARIAAMDWQIEGSTYFNYAVSVQGAAVAGFSESGTAYFAGAAADVDSDGVHGEVALSEPDLQGLVATQPANVTTAWPGTLGSCAGGAFGTPCTLTGPDVL
jgi:prepilin-type N-terminal cleavage/methylation domain-containing protein